MNVRKGKTTTPERVPGGTLVDRAMRLVEGLADGSVGRLVPVLTPESMSAYSYPDACEALGLAPGQEIAVLRGLADKGILDAEQVELVPVCPFCLTYALRVERFCPQCGDSHIHRTSMIHHFRCGNVSPEETYTRGHDLVCPKCDKQLRHIGVDYERPSRVWICDDDGHVMPEPELRYHSVTCGRKVPIDDVVDRWIYAYALSADGTLLATEGNIRAAIEGPSDVDALTGLPGAGVVARQLELERDRAKRYKTSFSVVQVRVANGDELEERFGEEAVSRLLKTLSIVARENLRTVDTLGRDGRHSLAAILPETDEDGTAKVIEKLSTSIEAYVHATGRDETHRAASIEAVALPAEAGSAE